MSDKVKLKGHESFSLREGWLTKGLYEIKNNPELFLEDNITDILGVGTNMVKAIKYWLITTGLIKEEKKGKYALSEIGELIYKYDPYFEDSFSLFLAHYNLVCNKEKAIIWNLFFNKCNSKIFNKKDLLEQMEYILEVEQKEYNEKILLDEINVLIKTYTIDEDKADNPENNFLCPFTELGLLKRIDKDLYQKQSPSFNKLSPYIVYYCMTNFVEGDAINIDDLLKNNDSVGKIFNFDKNILNEYLDFLKRQKMITVNRTAGLNMIYINKKYSIGEVFEKYFRREQ